MSKVTFSPDSQSVGQQLQAKAIARVDPGWVRVASVYLRRWLEVAPETWAVEDCRLWSEQHGCPVPTTGRAWGAVVKRAEARGQVVAVGVGRSRKPSRHAGFVTLWKGVLRPV